MLRKIGAYLLRETIPLYVLGVAAFCLLISIDYLSVMAWFLLEQNASLASVGLLLLYKIPSFLHLALPIAGVFAVLLATGRLARDSELKAAYSLSVPPAALLWPLLGFGLAISLLTLANNGWLEPLAERRYTVLVDSFYYTRPRAETQDNVAFTMPDGSIYYAAEIRSSPNDPEQAELNGVLLLLPDGTTVTAARGTWLSAEREWLLQDAQRAPPRAAPVEAGSLTLPFDFAGSPAATLTRGEQQTLTQLRQRIADAQEAGGQVRELSYELQRRVADAFSAACFVLVASLLGLGVRARSTAFAWTIGLLVVFYALWMLSGSLFDRHVLSPAGAAWLTPLLVTAAGTLLAAWRLRR